MNKTKTPRSLRLNAAMNSVGETFDNYSGRKVSAVAGLYTGTITHSVS